MKISFEVDITPEEVKELFEGNVDILQRSLIELFMKQMSRSEKVPDNNIMAFWQSMSEQSASMFEKYQQSMSGTSSDKK